MPKNADLGPCVERKKNTPLTTRSSWRSWLETRPPRAALAMEAIGLVMNTVTLSAHHGQ